MKIYNVLTMMLVLGISTSAFSNNYDRECRREKWTLVKEELKSPTSCKMIKELKLTEDLFVYPRINVGPINVSYWEGRFEKTVSKLQVYRHDYINICEGRITFSDEENHETSEVKVYDLLNPNLDPSISESYKLAPMTDEEAQTAFSNLKIECETDTQE